MDRKLCVRVLVWIVVFMFIGVAGATETTQTANETVLLNKIKQLESQIEILKTQNLKLEAENQKLQNELAEKSEWDAHNLMDMLHIYTLTSSGKEYKLLFHEGGLGGVTVYQYVGMWQGDAGKWRQYKQIAFFKGVQEDGGFIKPGVVIKPVWGFNGSKEIRVNSIADLIKWEKEYNSIEGLAEYYQWMFNRYLEASSYAGAKIFFVAVIALVFGMIVGELKYPIRRFLDYITIRRVTDFSLTPEEESKKKKKGLLRRR